MIHQIEAFASLDFPLKKQASELMGLSFLNNLNNDIRVTRMEKHTIQEGVINSPIHD